MLRTALTERWSIRYPILTASMTPAAGADLARAVSQAGGLGVFGLDWREERASLASQLDALRAAPDLPFGVGVVAWAIDLAPHLVEMAIEARPRFVCISFGDLAPLAARLRTSGVEVIAQVQDRATAIEAVRAGATVIVAQGTEAGGHTGRVGSLTLLQAVLDSVDVPVLAAGGIGSPRGVAAALAAGAAGVWVGTAFLFAEEARVPEGARARLRAAGEGDTVLTHAFDRVQGAAWPAAFAGRALRNRFTDQFHGREDAIDAAARGDFVAAKRAGNYDIANVYAGEAVGLSGQIQPAAAIVRSLAEGAEELLRDRSRSLLGEGGTKRSEDREV
jgi:nitronate monooxygenase